MILGLYRTLTSLGRPFILHTLDRRRRRGKEETARIGERLGAARIERPDGPLVWLHAASVGESLSALPLIDAILELDPNMHVLVTTVTVTSAALMAERLPERAAHQYVPVDVGPYLRRFLDHWRPDLAIWLESELWPNMILETAARNIPCALINGRMSERSLRGWKRVPKSAARLVSQFTVCLAQTETDAERFRALGAGRTECVGNLKFAAPPLPYDKAEHDRLLEGVGVRPRWLAASTHSGEEALCGAVHARLAPSIPGLLTIIVPRHPDRGQAITEELRRSGFRVARRSADPCPDATTDIYIADTIGELGLFYRLCPIAFIGKSLGAEGGQNPLEAARLGCAVLFGPRMSNFTDIAARLSDSGGAQVVADADALGGAVRELIGDRGETQRRGDAARIVAETEAGVLERIVERLAPILERGENDHART